MLVMLIVAQWKLAATLPSVKDPLGVMEAQIVPSTPRQEVVRMITIGVVTQPTR